MDNFELTVLVGDVLVIISLITLIALDKGPRVTTPPEPSKPGKKTA